MYQKLEVNCRKGLLVNVKTALVDGSDGILKSALLFTFDTLKTCFFCRQQDHTSIYSPFLVLFSAGKHINYS